MMQDLGNHPDRFIALGVAVGVALGVVTDNLGLWLAIGVAVGIALAQKEKAKNKDE